MIHLIEIDDTTRNGKRLLREARQLRTGAGVKFRSPAINGVPPEGYVCGEEAYKKLSIITDELCRKYGLLE